MLFTILRGDLRTAKKFYCTTATRRVVWENLGRNNPSAPVLVQRQAGGDLDMERKFLASHGEARDGPDCSPAVHGHHTEQMFMCSHGGAYSTAVDVAQRLQPMESPHRSSSTPELWLMERSCLAGQLPPVWTMCTWRVHSMIQTHTGEVLEEPHTGRKWRWMSSRDKTLQTDYKPIIAWVGGGGGCRRWMKKVFSVCFQDSFLYYYLLLIN